MKKMLTFMMTIVMVVSLSVVAACNQDISLRDPSNPPEEEEIDIPSENEDEEVTDEEEQPEQDGNKKPDEQKEPSENLEDKETVDETNLSPKPDEVKETHVVVLYFSDNDLMDSYRIEMEVEVKKGDHLAKAALEAWIKGPDHEELSGLIHSEVIIEYVEDVDGIAHVSFSKEIKDSNLGSTGELMLAEQLSMIMQQFGFDRTQILVEGRVGETLLGHLYTGDPFVANSPESYLWIDEKESEGEIVLQNVAFRIFEPVPGTEVRDRIVIRGLARVYEGTILYEFEDGHFILAEGFTTASEGAPGWGEFEIIIELDDVADYSGRVILFEESAKDGSRINELQIPVHVVK